MSSDAATVQGPMHEQRDPARVPFQPSADPQPDDQSSVRMRREVKELVIAQRDRLDPATDSLGRPRTQRSIDSMVEVLVRKGLQWAATLPDWTDPLALD